MMEKARKLVKKLNFDECVEVYSRLEAGHPMIDLLFERMEEIDPERFEEWL